ncbi:MAG TPA: D-glycero-beta-D-manno-heptose-7-phosphate kinase [Cytophagales bacterium]|nr:D-glycero-beta-D-manno-heptose-7-phosphate kinase [Cytophagales bacterium]HAA19118.1 D-glycero-beta-D-manno-heptose-7-phosphate kinase [Cytophagales bacterium]HAP62723.1 D-glycero-beta-D-manno-heptose-7-phosphate kinase [Cytophagales bacterium]
MTINSLDQVFHAFTDLRALIIGDVMLDSYVWGSADRISPEAPVPVVKVNRCEYRLGGAANVALNLQALGAKPVLCSIIGDDLPGREFVELLRSQKISAEGIIQSEQRVTTVKERVLSGSQHILRVDTEDDTELSDLEASSLIQHIQQLIDKSDVVIFEDYDKGALNQRVIEATIGYAKEHNVPTVVDPKLRNFHHYHEATLFKPNLKELREGLRIQLQDGNMDDVVAAGNQLRETLALNKALVTLSSKGMLYLDNEGQHHIPAEIRSISDVSGAGDTVVSIAALCEALGLPPRFMIALANLGGGQVCEYLGVVPVNRDRLMEEAASHQLGDWL